MAPVASSSFTPAQSLLRLTRLQKLCSSLSLDALVFIAGVDGLDHTGTQHALNYLFAGEGLSLTVKTFHTSILK